MDSDSVSEITDLSEDGILTSSLALLPQAEQARLKKYNEQFRKMLNLKMKGKHDCYRLDNKIQKRPNDMRYMVEMELRAKSEPKEFSEEGNSAH